MAMGKKFPPNTVRMLEKDNQTIYNSLVKYPFRIPGNRLADKIITTQEMRDKNSAAIDEHRNYFPTNDGIVILNMKMGDLRRDDEHYRILDASANGDTLRFRFHEKLFSKDILELESVGLALNGLMTNVNKDGKTSYSLTIDRDMRGMVRHYPGQFADNEEHKIEQFIGAPFGEIARPSTENQEARRIKICGKDTRNTGGIIVRHVGNGNFHSPTHEIYITPQLSLALKPIEIVPDASAIANELRDKRVPLKLMAGNPLSKTMRHMLAQLVGVVAGED